MAFTVIVTGAEVAGLLITSKPVKRTYKKGEELDLKGMIVVEMYSNGTTRQLGAGDYEVAGYNKDQVGTQFLTVS